MTRTTERLSLLVKFLKNRITLFSGDVFKRWKNDDIVECYIIFDNAPTLVKVDAITNVDVLAADPHPRRDVLCVSVVW